MKNSEEIKPLKKSYLNLIKSKYIFKYIFSFLTEKRGLLIIYYNKQYRNKLPYDQKKIYGKYLKIEKDGYGREYSNITKKVLYEGYFKNYKKKGKGKEYYENDGSIKFKGKYLNGKRYKGKGYDNNGNLVIRIEKGKIEELYKNGKLQFEGEYYNNKKWNGKGYNLNGNEEYEIKCGRGNAKEYDYNGNLIFEGEYLNGERNGQGKEFIGNRIKFEGQYINGKRNGKGKEFFLNGKIKFEGNYLNGKRNGKGKEYNYFNENVTFEGENLMEKKIIKMIFFN